jgi:signal transduction histidine kinase
MEKKASAREAGRQAGRACVRTLHCAIVLLLAMLTCMGLDTLHNPAHSAGRDSDREPIQILLLHPDDLHSRRVLETDAATRSALVAALPFPLEFHSEGFEALRLAGMRLQEPAFVEALVKKYSSHPPDLIVTHDEVFAVVLRHRSELWPDTPLMSVDVAEPRLRAGELPADIPHVAIAVDLEGTFRLARQMQPDARRVLVVFGTADHDQYWGQYAMRLLAPYRQQMQIEATDQRSLAETQKILEARGLETIVLYLGVLQDRAGHSYVAGEATQRIVAVSKAPVYSPWGSAMGLGIVGGVITQTDLGRAQAIGELARRLLSGEAASSVPSPHVVPAVCSIDWRALHHWRLPSAGIPSGCRILREPSFLAAHRNASIATGTVTVLLIALLLGLLRQTLRRRSAERAMQQQREELAHVDRLAAAGRLTASITHEINQSLTAILSNAEAASLLLARDNPPLAEIRHILEDIGADDIRASEVIRRLRGLLTKQVTERRNVSFHEVVEETLKVLESMLKSHQITVVLDLTTPTPIVEGDRVQLQQVLLNLVINAVEACRDLASERRGIRIQTRVDDNDQLHVAVSDLGCGFEQERLPTLFDPFVSSKKTGMGLGLFLVRAIVEAHGGLVSAENNAVGATFSFTVPCNHKSRGDAVLQSEAG